MTRMTGPDCAVMCNLIKIHTYVEDISIIFHCSFAVGITQQYGIYVLLG